MRRNYRETAAKCAARSIKEKREAAAMFPALCEVIRAFDGKIYNKRLDNAIRERLGRSVFTQNKQGAYNSALWVYVYTDSHDTITLLWINIPDDKRINANDFIDCAKNTRDNLLKEAAHTEQIIPTIETRKTQIEYIKNLLSGVLDDLTYEEKDIFGLNIRIN